MQSYRIWILVCQSPIELGRDASLRRSRATHARHVASSPLQMNPQAELQNSGHSGNLQASRLGIDSIFAYRPNYGQQSSVCWVTEPVQFGQRELSRATRTLHQPVQEPLKDCVVYMREPDQPTNRTRDGR